jgi:hypothetical protein
LAARRRGEHLQLDTLPVQLNILNLEVNPNGGDESWGE